MLKKHGREVGMLCLIVLLSGCSVLNPDAIRYRINHVTEELFSQSTITMPVLVTSTPTMTPTLPPTRTPTPTITPTPTATFPVMDYSTPTFEVLNTAELPISSKDEIKNVTDVTIPDDTVLDPGDVFVKSWRLTNSGEKVWEDGTRLMMEATYAMDTPPVVDAVFLKPNDWIDFTPGGWGQRVYNVAPGTEVDLAVILKAPQAPGSYSIYFRLVNADNEIIATPFWMRFSVSSPTATPTPTKPTGTEEPTRRTYNWAGRWMFREPFHTDGIIPVNAWLEQKDDEVRGFFYDSQGNPIIVRGALSSNGRIFTGEFFYPWQKQTTACTWRMQISEHQFHAITETGMIDETTICGARDGRNFPASCALPAEG